MFVRLRFPAAFVPRLTSQFAIISIDPVGFERLPVSSRLLAMMLMELWEEAMAVILTDSALNWKVPEPETDRFERTEIVFPVVVRLRDESFAKTVVLAILIVPELALLKFTLTLLMKLFPAEFAKFSEEPELAGFPLINMDVRLLFPRIDNVLPPAPVTFPALSVPVKLKVESIV